MSTDYMLQVLTTALPQQHTSAWIFLRLPCTTGDDIIFLHGSAADYSLTQNLSQGSTNIYRGTDANKDLIGVVQATGLSLNSSDFSYMNDEAK